MKVVIFGDSLALPRDDVGGDACFEVTYPFLIDQALRKRYGAHAPVLIERGRRLRTIEYVLDDWYEEVELKKPDAVVVHVGIVDCAPRVFLRRERAFVDRIRFTWVKKRLLKFAHDHRPAIIRMRPRVYVPVERFERHVGEVVRKAQAAKLKSLFFVNILAPSNNMENRSPGFQRNVELYNQVLQAQARHSFVEIIDINKVLSAIESTENLTVDGIHFSETPHRMLAQELERHLSQLMEKTTEAEVVMTEECSQ
jgi:lysophospholipase L1-like esterase